MNAISAKGERVYDPDRLQVFTREELNCIHDASMDILAHTGICFHEPDALAIFQQAGSLDGVNEKRTVFFSCSIRRKMK